MSIAGFGPVCTPELDAAGIRTVEDIRRMGWEEAFLRWVELFPSRLNVNAATGMLAAEQGVHWLKVDPADKGRVRALVRRIRMQSGKRR